MCCSQMIASSDWRIAGDGRGHGAAVRRPASRQPGARAVAVAVGAALWPRARRRADGGGEDSGRTARAGGVVRASVNSRVAAGPHRAGRYARSGANSHGIRDGAHTGSARCGRIVIRAGRGSPPSTRFAWPSRSWSSGRWYGCLPLRGLSAVERRSSNRVRCSSSAITSPPTTPR